VPEAVVDVLGEKFHDRSELFKQESREFVHDHAVLVIDNVDQMEAGRRGGVRGAVRADRDRWRRRE